jgi:hypothetical protein
MTEFARLQAAVETLLALPRPEQEVYLRTRFAPAENDDPFPALHLAWALPPDTGASCGHSLPTGDAPADCADRPL